MDLLELIVAAAGIALLLVALRVCAPARERRRTTRHWEQTIRSAPLPVPPKRYDPASSQLYAEPRPLTPTRY